jgi:uncharacterized protein (TIGR03000 family)
MFRNLLTSGIPLFLAGALFALTPSSAEAGHGGHGVGGFHGAAHFGGARVGGFHTGAYGRGYGHYGFNNWHNGYRGYYGGYGRYYGGYGGLYYPYFGRYYPYVGGYGGYYNPSYLSSYDPSLDLGATPYFSGYGSYSNTIPPDAGVNHSIAPPAGALSPGTLTPAPADERVHLVVTLPANAQLWINSASTTRTGSIREFQSVPLTPGVRYEYTIHARWEDNGREVDQTQRVQGTVGDSLNVTFPIGTGSTAQASLGSNG